MRVLTPCRDHNPTLSCPPAVTRITSGSRFSLSLAWHPLEIFHGRSDEMSWPFFLRPPREPQCCWSSGINLTPACFVKTKSAPQEQSSLSKRSDGVCLEIWTEGFRFGISLWVVIKGFGSLKWGSLLLKSVIYTSGLDRGVHVNRLLLQMGISNISHFPNFLCYLE